MLRTSSGRNRFVLAVSFMFALSVLAPFSLAGQPDRVVVVDYSVEGNVVHVTVENLSHKAQNAEVHVYATVNGEQVRGFTPVTLLEKGTVSTVVGFSQAVENVETVGINETDSPF